MTRRKLVAMSFTPVQLHEQVHEHEQPHEQLMFEMSMLLMLMVCAVLA